MVIVLACAFAARAQEACVRCHASVVAAFERSAMGRSIGLATASGPPAATTRVVHKLSGSTLTIRNNGQQMEHAVEQRGLTARYPVVYSVGAGVVGYSYVIRLGRYLYQSPISYYSQTKSWDLTPGYETERHPDFTHQITSGCLFCHTGSVNLIKGTTNQFASTPFTSISCERCHGPSAEHLKNPVPGSIVNPAKLSVQRRDSVCEQCHLEGDARILNPGRDWWDFRAGDTTESVFVTYLKKTDPGTLRAVSQSELLAQSQCARQSGGRLWCGTCHNPHETTANRAKAVQQVCLTCHAQIFKAGTHQPAEECVSCHMPRLRPTNVAHSAVTDHSIPRLPRLQNIQATAAQPTLHAWRAPGDPAFVARDLGVAYFDLATNTRAVPDLREAYEILSHLPPQERQSDATVEADLGSILLAQGQLKTALQLFENAFSRDPANARYAYVLGTALERSGNYGEAVKEFKKSIDLDPSQPDAYLELSEFYKKTGHDAESQSTLREYLRFMPQNILLRTGD